MAAALTSPGAPSYPNKRAPLRHCLHLLCRISLHHRTHTMFNLWLWLKNRQNRLWVIPMITALMAVVVVFAAKWVGSFWLAKQLPDIQVGTIDDLLTVIASSMLAVATFSLGILVSALSSSATTATPRATELLMGDDDTRGAIGSFMAAFTFAVVGKTALGVGFYDIPGRFVLFVSTLLVLTYVVFRLLLWVKTLSSLGRLSDTVERIERVSRNTLKAHVKRPLLGAAPTPQKTPSGTEIRAEDIGYLCHLNMSGLQEVASAAECTLHLHVRPGCFVGPDTVLATASRHNIPATLGEVNPNEAPPAPNAKEIRDCFVLGPMRSYDQDPRFGLIVLSEVALRALSPAVNDPGTAISVMVSLTTLVVQADHAMANQETKVKAALKDGSDAATADIEFDRLTLPALDVRTLVADGFAPIARDGASMLEVGVRLQKMLATIARNGSEPVAQEAQRQARRAIERGLAALTHVDDRQTLEALHRQLFSA